MTPTDDERECDGIDHDPWDDPWEYDDDDDYDDDVAVDCYCDDEHMP